MEVEVEEDDKVTPNFWARVVGVSVVCFLFFCFYYTKFPLRRWKFNKNNRKLTK